MTKNKKSTPKKRIIKKLNFKREIILFFSCCAIIILLILGSYNIYSYYEEKNVLGINIELNSLSEDEKRLYWKEVLRLYPTYLDGWVELALVEMVLGNHDSAKEAYEKARQINPNSQKVRFLQEKIIEEENYSSD